MIADPALEKSVSYIVYNYTKFFSLCNVTKREQLSQNTIGNSISGAPNDCFCKISVRRGKYCLFYYLRTAKDF